MTAALAIEDVSVSFGGVAALTEVTMGVRPGEILGVIGPNGAGKTTLLNVVSGLTRPRTGRVLLGGENVTGWKPSRIAARGLARTFQTTQLFAGMSVLENLMVGQHLRAQAGQLGSALGWATMRREERPLAERAREALEFVGMAAFADRPGHALSFGQQRIVEIARALVGEPRVVLLDEPAVGLSAPRVEELDRLLRRISRERGIALMMIEHVIRLVMGVSDRVAVLNSGALIAEGGPDEVRRNPDVVEAYLGRGSHA